MVYIEYMEIKALDLGPKTAALIQRLANEEQQQQARIAAANRPQIRKIEGRS